MIGLTASTIFSITLLDGTTSFGIGSIVEFNAVQVGQKRPQYCCFGVGEDADYFNVYACEQDYGNPHKVKSIPKSEVKDITYMIEKDICREIEKFWDDVQRIYQLHLVVNK